MTPTNFQCYLTILPIFPHYVFCDYGTVFIETPCTGTYLYVRMYAQFLKQVLECGLDSILIKSGEMIKIVQEWNPIVFGVNRHSGGGD